METGTFVIFHVQYFVLLFPLHTIVATL